MANSFSTDILVKRRVRDGWYVYTCDELPGLFVAAMDDRVAYHDVPKSIRMLFKLDHGRDCIVTHKLTYADFVQRIALGDRARTFAATRTAELMGNAMQHIAFTLFPHQAAVAVAG